MWSKLKKFFRILLYSLLVIVFFVILNGIFGKKKPDLAVIPDKIDATSRSFYLGFTTFPPDISNVAVDQMYAFINANSDIIAHHFDAGIPWVEAYTKSKYSEDLENNWKVKKSRADKNMPLYIAITPMNSDRTALAKYWGTHDNMDLPGDWANLRFNDERIKTAYLNYAESVIDFFHPTYLAIGIESDMLISQGDKWDDYLELNQYVYQALKRQHPSLLVFSTVQLEHLKGLSGSVKSSVEVEQVKKLLNNSDILALSTYSFNMPPTVDYFDLALSMDKPLAIAESGAMSDEIKISGYKFEGSLEKQRQFESFLLDQANKHNFLFVVNFVPIDFDKLLAKLPAPINELAKYWVHTGLVDSSGNPKPALSVWDGYLKLPKQ